MIILNTHGAKNNGEVSHSVAMARNAAKNLKNLQGATTVSLDSLRPIIELAKDKGVKLAFVDQSCYSGNSLNLPHTDACIISATGANHYSYSNSINFLGLSMSFDFSGKFNKLLKPGKSLEDIFLKARKSGNEPDFPMISSPAGLEIQKVLYELATPYLNDDIKDSDVIYSYAKIDEISCQAASHFNELMSVISTIENAKNISMSTEDFEQLKNALKAYRDYQVEHENLYKELSSISDQIKNDIKMNFPDKEHLFFESDGVSILNANYDNSIKVFQEFFDKETNVLSREVYQKILNDLSAKKKIAQEIKSKLSTENRSKIDKLKQIEESSSAYKYSSIVSKSMRKLYNALYKGNLKTENNPCRDFVL